MPKLLPITWQKFVRKLKKLGYEGPYYGGKHPYMIKKDFVLTIPNPYKKDIGKDLLSRILKQADILLDEWNIV